MNKIFRILKGIGDTATGGLVTTVTENIKSKDGGEGKLDYFKLGGNVIMLAIILGVIFGATDVETAERLMKLISKFQFWN